MKTKTLTLEACLETRTRADDENIAPEDYREPDSVLEFRDYHIIPGDGDVNAMGDYHDPRWECGFYLQNPSTGKHARLGEYLKKAWREGRTISAILVARDVKSKKGEGFIL